MTKTQRLAAVAVAFYVLLTSVVTVRAQWTVWDPAAFVQNEATNFGLQQSLQWLNQQLDRLEQMSHRLSRYTSLARFRAPGAPLWRTHDTTAPYAGEFLSALTYGDATGQGYRGTRRALSALSPPRALPPQVDAIVRSQLASLEAADSIIIAGTDQTGRLRRNGREIIRVIELLEQIITDGSPTQSATAVLDKISAGSYMRSRQGQTRQQLILSLLQTELLNTKRRRDSDAAAMNTVLDRVRDDGARTRALYAGTADALGAWTQP